MCQIAFEKATRIELPQQQWSGCRFHRKITPPIFSIQRHTSSALHENERPRRFSHQPL